MNKKKSKVLAFLLATAMLVPSSNGIVSAADLMESKELVEDVNISNDKIDENLGKYDLSNTKIYVENESQLRDALKKGGEVILSNDIEIGKIGEIATNDNAIRITNDTVLNLNGYTIINNFLEKRPIIINTKYFKLVANGGGIKVANGNIGSYGFFEIGPRGDESVKPETVIIDGGTYSGNTDRGSFFKVYSAADNANIKFNKLDISTNGIGIDTDKQNLTNDNIKFDFEGGSYDTGRGGIRISVPNINTNAEVSIKGIKMNVDKGSGIYLEAIKSEIDNCEIYVSGDYVGGDTWERAAIGIAYDAIVNVKSGIYSAKTENMGDNEGYGVYIYTSGGTLNIEDGTFEGTTASLRADSKDYGIPANIVIENGTFIGDVCTNTAGKNHEVNITINNGDFEGDIHTKTTGNGNKSNIIINNGKFNGDIYTNILDDSDASIVINKGEFSEITEEGTINRGKDNHLTVNGGKFNKSVKDFVNNDLKVEADKNGEYKYYKDIETAKKESEDGTNFSSTIDKDKTDGNYTFIYNNVELDNIKSYIENGTEKVILGEPGKEGYKFLYWKYNGKKYNSFIEYTMKDFGIDVDSSTIKEIKLEPVWEKVQTPSIPSKPIHPTYDHTSIIGSDRYETAGKIADKLGSYDTAVLVNATSTMSDGLSAAGLAGKEDAAILLVKKDSIPKATMDRLSKVKKVYIIGGENAISQKVVNQLNKNNVKVNVERLGGKTRVETSELVAKEIGSYKKAFVVNGFKGEADAMSASSVAAREEAPILLTNGKSSSTDRQSGVSYYVVGGKSVMNDSIVKKYKAERIAGDDRYETNREMINEFYGASETLYFANGETLVDALTASTISKDDGLVLVGRKSDNKILNKKNTIQVGGMKFDVDFEK